MAQRNLRILVENPGVVAVDGTFGCERNWQFAIVWAHAKGASQVLVPVLIVMMLVSKLTKLAQMDSCVRMHKALRAQGHLPVIQETLKCTSIAGVAPLKEIRRANRAPPPRHLTRRRPVR